MDRCDAFYWVSTLLYTSVLSALDGSCSPNIRQMSCYPNFKLGLNLWAATCKKGRRKMCCTSEPWSLPMSSIMFVDGTHKAQRCLRAVPLCQLWTPPTQATAVGVEEFSTTAPNDVIPCLQLWCSLRGAPPCFGGDCSNATFGVLGPGQIKEWRFHFCCCCCKEHKMQDKEICRSRIPRLVLRPHLSQQHPYHQKVSPASESPFSEEESRDFNPLSSSGGSARTISSNSFCSGTERKGVAVKMVVFVPGFVFPLIWMRRNNFLKVSIVAKILLLYLLSDCDHCFHKKHVFQLAACAVLHFYPFRLLGYS